MGIALSSLESDIKSRVRRLGAFTASASLERLRYAILRASIWCWNQRDWDFRNKTATLTTTAGDRGPYDTPADFLRFAVERKVALFGFVDKDTLAPILASDDVIYTPYIKIQDGKIYFFTDPGSGDLTLNYQYELEDSATEADLTTTMALFPVGLKPAITKYAIADLYDDVKGKQQDMRMAMADAKQLLEEYWYQSTMGTLQKTISPKGVNKVNIDNHAKVITVLGSERDKWRSVNA